MAFAGRPLTQEEPAQEHHTRPRRDSITDSSSPQPATARAAALGLVVLAAILLALGCESTRLAEGPPPVDPPASYDGGAGEAPDPQWFEFFDAPQLAELVERALGDNFELRSAWRRLEEAEAIAAQQGAALGPQVSLSGEATRQKTNIVGPFGGTGGGPGLPPMEGSFTYSTYRLGLGASYELDLWGRLGSAERAAVLDAEASFLDARALAVTVAAQVTGAWLDLIMRRRRLELLDEQIEVASERLELAALRLGLGQGAALDVTQQEQQIEALRARVAQERLAAEVATNRLAVLVGRAPQHFEIEPPPDLPTPGPLPAVGVPADLLERRPDVQAARLRLRAADERVAAAVAEKLPRIRLSANLFTQAAEIGNLFEELLWSVAASFDQTVLDAGATNARAEASRARAARALEQLGQTYLQALREVADALDSEAEQRAYLARLRRQLVAARDALELASRAFAEGAVDYQRVLSALSSLFELQQELVSARRQLLGYRVQLHRALGGSWPAELAPERPESPYDE